MLELVFTEWDGMNIGQKIELLATGEPHASHECHESEKIGHKRNHEHRSKVEISCSRHQ